MKATTRSPQIRRVVARAHGRAQCPICRKYSRFNDETLAAFREADEDERHFRETGEHLIKPQTLEEFFAEVNRTANRKDKTGNVYTQEHREHVPPAHS